MIYITGDTHGDIKRLKTRAAKKLSKDDTLIICGDFGFLWDESDDENKKLEFLNSQKYQILFVDGTHENFKRIESHPVVDLYSGKAHKISRNIYHLMRGEIYN
ncbi:MAG: metallophosphoesterase, partial [Ruminococcus sp.]|nr:metallophosphoesterase [Ruminococcus sp.]